MRLNLIVQGLIYCLLTIYTSLFSTLSVADDIPELSAWMIDKTNTLSAAQQSELNSLLENHEKQTHKQFIVLMISTLNGESIEEYAVKVFEKWQLGQKGKDNGLLLVIAKSDRKLRIEVGYGLEGKITDAISGRIIRNDIAPYFKKNDYFGGISHGVHRLLDVSNNTSIPSKSKSNAVVVNNYSPEVASLIEATKILFNIITISTLLIIYLYIRFILKKRPAYLLALVVIVSAVPNMIIYYYCAHLLSFIKGVALPTFYSGFSYYALEIFHKYIIITIGILFFTTLYYIAKTVILIVFSILLSENLFPENESNDDDSNDSDRLKINFKMGSSSSSSSSSRPSGGGGRSGGGGASGGW